MSFRTFTFAALPLAAAVIACGDPSGPPDRSLGAFMLGDWTHSSELGAPPDSPSLNVGLSVSIVIDSARDMRFWGHVARWFAGDVGLPVNRFGPVSGDIDSANAVVLRIAPGSTQGSMGNALTIQGQVDGDLLIVHSSWAGVDQGPFAPGCRFERLH